jgi:hypothetical protein
VSNLCLTQLISRDLSGPQMTRERRIYLSWPGNTGLITQSWFKSSPRNERKPQVRRGADQAPLFAFRLPNNPEVAGTERGRKSAGQPVAARAPTA